MPRIKQVNPQNRSVLKKIEKPLKPNDGEIKPSKQASGGIKKRRKRPGTAALMEMRRLQKKCIHMLPTAPFRRLVTDITMSLLPVGESIRIQSKAIDALKEGASAYLHHTFVMANAFCVKDARLSLSKEDFVTAANIISGRFHEFLDMNDASDRIFTSGYTGHLSTHKYNTASAAKKSLSKHGIESKKVDKEAANNTG
ncbi:hypothetical protein CYMTET_41395 [Cymbomonas tetramitiformis]|uniref:Core Histone H2A/H2B/H3 domain-containing protein n=1 Tax=Cymbomonas tetramitiformis TaxID=36881 RepID=A0AAE0C899_9CHLO|nr:hypothetical protein CYMTET_41395 [Cymbomonas tetramitiformis]|eukprot:gene30909-38746_t